MLAMAVGRWHPMGFRLFTLLCKRNLSMKIHLLVALSMFPAASAAADPTASAARILSAANVQGGLVVHLGCGDGKLTAALRANDSFIVHGLDADAKNIEAARQHIQSLGIYGKVLGSALDGRAAALRGQFRQSGRCQRRVAMPSREQSFYGSSSRRRSDLLHGPGPPT